MPAQPRWLLALPDAIRQLDTLDRDLLKLYDRTADTITVAEIERIVI